MFVLTCVLEFIFVILTLYAPIVGRYHLQTFIMD